MPRFFRIFLSRSRIYEKIPKIHKITFTIETSWQKYLALARTALGNRFEVMARERERENGEGRRRAGGVGALLRSCLISRAAEKNGKIFASVTTLHGVTSP